MISEINLAKHLIIFFKDSLDFNKIFAVQTCEIKISG